MLLTKYVFISTFLSRTWDCLLYLFAQFCVIVYFKFLHVSQAICHTAAIRVVLDVWLLLSLTIMVISMMVINWLICSCQANTAVIKWIHCSLSHFFQKMLEVSRDFSGRKLQSHDCRVLQTDINASALSFPNW